MKWVASQNVLHGLGHLNDIQVLVEFFPDSDGFRGAVSAACLQGCISKLSPSSPTSISKGVHLRCLAAHLFHVINNQHDWSAITGPAQLDRIERLNERARRPYRHLTTLQAKQKLTPKEQKELDSLKQFAAEVDTAPKWRRAKRERARLEQWKQFSLSHA